MEVHPCLLTLQDALHLFSVHRKWSPSDEK